MPVVNEGWSGWAVEILPVPTLQEVGSPVVNEVEWEGQTARMLSEGWAWFDRRAPQALSSHFLFAGLRFASTLASIAPG